MRGEDFVGEQNRKRVGDRPDGYRIRHLSATAVGAMGFMRSRVEAQVFSTFEPDLTKTEAFIQEQKDNLKGISLQTILFASMIRAYAKYPRCGRFIIGKKLYGREDLRINIMVKPKYDVDEEEILVPILFDRSETLPQVIEKYNAALEYRLEQNEQKKIAVAQGFKNPKAWISNNIDLLGSYMSGLVMFLDRHRLLPMSLLEISPFHGTIFVTNGGSIGLNNVTHHLYEFGTVSLFVGIGSKSKKLKVTEDGVESKNSIHISSTVDERICEGYYWACTMRLIKRLIENPELLMVEPKEVIMDR